MLQKYESRAGYTGTAFFLSDEFSYILINCFALSYRTTDSIFVCFVVPAVNV